MNWQAIATGYLHTVALRAYGTLWTWGYNNSGQLGNGTTDTANTPQSVQSNMTWQAVAAGGGSGQITDEHTLALRADGTLWAWGSNGQGQLGNGTTNNANTPQEVLGDAVWGTPR